MLWADRLVVLVSVLWRDLHTDSWRSVPICILTSSRWGVPFPVILVSMYSHLGFLMAALVTGSKGLSSSFNLPFPGGGEGCWGPAKILHGRLCSFSEELYSVHWGPTYSLDDWGCLIFISILSDVGNKDFLGGKTLLRSGSGFLGEALSFYATLCQLCANRVSFSGLPCLRLHLEVFCMSFPPKFQVSW